MYFFISRKTYSFIWLVPSAVLFGLCHWFVSILKPLFLFCLTMILLSLGAHHFSPGENLFTILRCLLSFGNSQNNSLQSRQRIKFQIITVCIVHPLKIFLLSPCQDCTSLIYCPTSPPSLSWSGIPANRTGCLFLFIWSRSYLSSCRGSEQKLILLKVSVQSAFPWILHSSKRPFSKELWKVTFFKGKEACSFHSQTFLYSRGMKHTI